VFVCVFMCVCLCVCVCVCVCARLHVCVAPYLSSQSEIVVKLHAAKRREVTPGLHVHSGVWLHVHSGVWLHVHSAVWLQHSYR
jgi:hypothetical protein